MTATSAPFIETSAAMMVVLPGKPYPLGATWDGAGVNFALFSAHAERVELCLFDAEGRSEERRIAIGACTDQIWHCYVDGLAPGACYGYRVHGPHDPARGHRFAPEKLLLDPYARRWHGRFDWPNVEAGDNAGAMPKCVVHDDAFDWGDDRPPSVAWSDTILYECHVKGYTMRAPGVPEALRGTYPGFASAAAIEHLQKLGVTAVSLLPIHAIADERHLRQRGLVNYWGYNSIGYFLPDARYSVADPVDEFKAMVKGLHSAGIEVILDVVYNHTGEGDELGPTLSFRGIDNASYYRLLPGNLALYENWSGCGNTPNVSHPRVLQLVLDSLRYWVREMHVDGFRFDLAAALVRDAGGFCPGSAFLQAVAQDPELARVKLIAEPWDVAENGYRLGRFPPRWGEWNDRYRDALRGYWLTRSVSPGELATRLTGSSDFFRHDGRRPQASVNFVTAHDGFTLTDLVSYSHRHNEANGEGNRDGHAHNLSWNCGYEGPADDAQIVVLRARLKRAMLATLLLSQGTPMLLAGDEHGHSQAGNNNAYCQDNALTWLDWAVADKDLCRYTCRLIELRKSMPALRLPFWLEGQSKAGGERDVTWISRSGDEMAAADWAMPENRCFAFALVPRGGDGKLLVLLNSEREGVKFILPDGTWRLLLDSAKPQAESGALLEAYLLEAVSVVVLQRELKIVS